MTNAYVVYLFVAMTFYYAIRLFVYCLIFYVVLRGLNYIHLKRYRQTMLVIERDYPDLYDSVRPATDVKRTSKGYQRAIPLIELAKSSKLSEYPELAKHLIDFVKFDRTLKQIRIAAIFIILILGVVYVVLFFNGIGW